MVTDLSALPDAENDVIPIRLPFHSRVWVRDALHCDSRAAELKIDLI